MKRLIVLLIAAVMMISLAACKAEVDLDSIAEDIESAAAKAQESTAAQQTEKATEAATEQATQAQSGSQSSSSDTDGSDGSDEVQKLTQTQEVTTSINVSSSGVLNAGDIFTDRDLTQTADVSDATYYSLSDGTDITITTGGVYVISGSAGNASIIVNTSSDDKVQLVLNGVSITNQSAPAIYVKNADKVFVTTVSGTTNSLSVTGTFTADGTTNTDAVIFSKDDLVLNGLGTLSISSTDNGVTSKDDLKITGGTIDVNCVSDAFEANESIAIADGSITINTGKDGLHAENDEDDSTGYVYICGGTLNVTAGSDGIQATTVAQIDGGSISISGSEGIEATYVQINGGTINISASDDGINGSAKSSAYSVTVELNGGDITINMGQGDTDGVDSNGNLYINGGTISVTGQSAFDYDGQGQLNGGTVTVNGSQITELTNQMMGGGMGGQGGMMGGQPGGMGGFGR